MTEYRVPRLMWESLEASLRVAGKQFVRRLAKTLEVPEKDLMKEVFKQDDLKVCIHDWTDEDFMCPAWKIHDAVYVPCDRAKMCGKECCKEHQGFSGKGPGTELNSVCCLEKSEEGEPDQGGEAGSIDVETMKCYNKLFNLIGTTADMHAIAQKSQAGQPISLTEFMASIKGYVDDDGVLKMVK